MTREEWENAKKLHGALDTDFVSLVTNCTIRGKIYEHIAEVGNLNPTYHATGQMITYGNFYRKDEHGNFIKLKPVEDRHLHVKPSKRRIDFATGAEAVAWAAQHPMLTVSGLLRGHGVWLWVRHDGLLRLVTTVAGDETELATGELARCTGWHVEVEE